MTTVDRIADLSAIWKHVTMIFPYFDRCDLDWDTLYRQYLEQVLTVTDQREFHLLLAEFVNRLGDGHTVYDFPWEFLNQVGALPFSLRYCADGYYISEIEETHTEYLYARIERINGIPFKEILQKAFRYIYHVEDYAPAFQLNRILPLFMQVKENKVVTSKGIFSFDLGRTKEQMGPMTKVPQPQASYPAQTISSQRLDIRRYGDILYIKSDNFMYSRTAEEIEAAIRWMTKDHASDRSLDNRSHHTKSEHTLPALSGIILDLRENIGGMTKFGADVAKLFISGEFHGCQKRTQSMRSIDLACASQYITMSPENLKATLAVGLGSRDDIEESLRFGRHCHYEEYVDTHGAPDHKALTDLPCVILTSRDTISAAEDTVAMFRSNHRAIVMGTPPTGTTGTPMMLPLSCGGRARICSVGYRLLDGTEFIGVGIQPDVLVETYLADLENGRDVVLEQALHTLGIGGGV